ncbi:MAG: SH3 domain-containing protein, partial [Candidatus Wallbacteria bacterium]|nr:SH3 domain-containing protein [Candidatus Wallbacteria bacterium]
YTATMNKYSATMIFMLFCCAEIQAAENPRAFVQFPSKIPGLSMEMLYADFWAGKLQDSDSLLDSEINIRRRNREHLKMRNGLENLALHPAFLTSSEVLFLIRDSGYISKSTRYFEGRTIEVSFYDTMLQNRNLEAVEERNTVRFGMTVKRVEARMFPSELRLFSEPGDIDFDRLLVAVMYALEPVVIVHVSRDGEWYLAKSAFFTAWVRADSVAVGSRLEVLDYAKQEPFLVVTGKRICTGVDAYEPRVSEFPADMGQRLPLADRWQIPDEIGSRIPDGNFVVRLPMRNTDGSLSFGLGLISRSDDISIGYLPYTRRNILNQAFKFLGQRYGWGGLFGTRDCSSFLKDIYATMGVILPRNSRFQGQIAPGEVVEFPKKSTLPERIRIIESLPGITPVYMSGHVMLYLGKHRNDYYIIHDGASLRVKNWSRELKSYNLMGVAVTPLLSTYLSGGGPFLEALYAARNFVFTEQQENE